MGVGPAFACRLRGFWVREWTPPLNTLCAKPPSESVLVFGQTYIIAALLLWLYSSTLNVESFNKTYTAHTFHRKKTSGYIQVIWGGSRI